jgi:hypothetical protein
MALLAAHPADRPSSAAVVASELRRIGTMLATRRKRRRNLAVAAVSVASVLLGYVLIATRRQQEPAIGSSIPQISGNASTLGTAAVRFAVARQHVVGKHPFDVAAADFNHDGQLDLAVSNWGGSAVCVLVGGGDGTFGAAAPFDTGPGPFTIAVEDYNGDGHPDIAVATEQNHSLEVLLESEMECSSAVHGLTSVSCHAVWRQPTWTAIATSI